MTKSLILVAPPLKLDIQDERAWLEGSPVKLGLKPFRLLHALMNAPKQLITKDELIDQVWDGRVVTDAVLTTAMRDLRKALSDDAHHPTFIETVHGRGYRFLLPVHTEEPTSSNTPPETQATGARRRMTRRNMAWTGIILIGLIALLFFWRSSIYWVNAPDDASIDVSARPLVQMDPASIAVLPFEDLSEAGNQVYFAKGLAEEILNALVRVDGLKVASRTSSFSFSERGALPLPTIARELGVRHILEGSVRTSGDRVRVTAQLIDAQTDAHRWSEIYERELTVENLFSIQDDIAGSITTAMETELGQSLGVTTGLPSAGTTDFSAYDAYLHGRELFIGRRHPDEALRFARKAVNADPEFARGWELLAATAFVQNGEPTAEAQNAAAAALILDPNLSLAHAIKAVMGNINPPYDWPATITGLERAVELDPKNTSALLWLGVEWRKLGYLNQAQTMLERCLEIDSAYTRCRLHLVWTLHMKGETDLALAQYHWLTKDGAQPDDAVMLAAALKRGDAKLADSIVGSFRSDTPIPSIIYEAIKNPPLNRKAVNDALDNWLDTETSNPRDYYPIFMAFGRYDLIPTEQGSFFGLWLPEYPEYRQSSEFKDFIRRMQIDDFWQEHGFPPQCEAMNDNDFRCQ